MGRSKDTSPQMDIWLIEVLDLTGNLLGRLSGRAMLIGLAALMACVALVVAVIVS